MLALLSQTAAPSTATGAYGRGPSEGPDQILTAPPGAGTRHITSSPASLRTSGAPTLSKASTNDLVPRANQVVDCLVFRSRRTISFGPPASSMVLPPPHAAPAPRVQLLLSLVSCSATPPVSGSLHTPRPKAINPYAAVSTYSMR